jgi:hypothetical protein
VLEFAKGRVTNTLFLCLIYSIYILYYNNGSRQPQRASPTCGGLDSPPTTVTTTTLYARCSFICFMYFSAAVL